MRATSPLRRSHLSGRAVAGQRRNAFRSAAKAALLPASLDQRVGNVEVAAADQCAGALRTTDLVRR